MTREQGRGIAPVLFPFAAHAGVLLIVFCFFVLILPRFTAVFEHMNMPLPGHTRLMLNFGMFLQHFWFPIIPFVLIGDFLASFLFWRAGGRRWLRLWSVALVIVLGSLVVLAGLSLAQPLRSRPSEASDEYFSRLPRSGPKWEQHSYVVQQLTSDVWLTLVNLGFRPDRYRVELTPDLSRARSVIEGITRIGSNGMVQPITNANVELRYLGEGRWYGFGTGQLQEVQFESSTGQWMSNGPVRVPSPPPCKRFDDLGLPYPKLHVILAWNGQTQAFPNPVRLAEAIQESGNYEAWHRLAATTNSLGYTFGYALFVSVPKPGQPQKATGLNGGVHVRRPNGTVLAGLVEFDGINYMLKATVDVCDDSGKHVVAKVVLERERQGSPFRIVEVRWHPETGYERVWTVNRFGVVYLETTVSPGGERKTTQFEEEFTDKPYETAAL